MRVEQIRDLSDKGIANKKAVLDYLPSDLIIEFPNQKCNSRCPYCYYSYLNNQYKASIDTENTPLLMWSKIEPYIEKFSSINISGGEPFANDFIIDLYQKLLNQNKKPKPYMITNGTLLSDIWIKKLIDNFSIISFSINSINPKTYGKITGLNGKYLDIALRNLNKLLKLRGDKKAPEIMVNFVVNNINYKEIPDFVNYMDAIGLDYIELNMIRERFNLKDNKSYFLLTEFRDEIVLLHDLRKIIKQIEEMNLKTRLCIERVKYRLVADEIKDLKNPYPFCVYPWVCFNIWLNGGVKFCPWQNGFIGNILEDDLENIWNGAKAVEFRQKIIHGKFQEVCDWKYCPQMARVWAEASYL